MLSLIAAVAENGVIGNKGALPWRLPDDLAHFRRTTLGKPVVMGRRTYESLGRPLPRRTNIVVTRNPDFAAAAPNVRVAHSLDAALVLAAEAPEVVVIGGAMLYAEALPAARRIYLTRVYGRPAGDVYFPELNRAEWHESLVLEHPADMDHLYAFSIVQLDRR